MPATEDEAIPPLRGGRLVFRFSIPGHGRPGPVSVRKRRLSRFRPLLQQRTSEPDAVEAAFDRSQS